MKVDDLNLCYRGEVYGHGDLMSFEDLERYERINSISSDFSRTWYLNGAPVGVALVGLRSRRSWLGAFAVEPSVRRRGFASLFIDELQRDLERSEMQSLELEVQQRNAGAIQTYIKRNFRRTGELSVWTRPGTYIQGIPAAPERADADRVVSNLSIGNASCWGREFETVLRAAPTVAVEVESAWASLAMREDRTDLLAIEAESICAAHRLLDRLESMSSAPLRLINEAVSSPVHRCLSERAQWQEVLRQWRMVWKPEDGTTRGSLLDLSAVREKR